MKVPEAVARALRPEIGKTKRFWVDVRVKEGKVIIFGGAKDLSALRAAINSYARWLYLAKNIEKVVATIQQRGE